MPRRPRCRWVAAPPALLLAAIVAPPAAAWTPGSQLAIGEWVADLAPPDLARQIDRHRGEFRRGVLAPFEDGDPTRHFQDADGNGRLAGVIQEEAERAVAAIRSHRPFAEIVHQLGVLSHYVADANNPLNAARDDREEARYFADFVGYAESVQPRFAVLFYGLDPLLQGPDGLAGLAERSLRRGRELYPHVGQEYRRIGFGPGRALFDDRSTAYGVASLTFSYAVTDGVLALRHVWIEAGGIDPRSALPVRGDVVLLLPPRSVPSP